MGEEDEEGYVSPRGIADEDEHAGQKLYHLMYERTDGKVVEESIWARRHEDAVRIAGEHGMTRLLSLERESSHRDVRSRSHLMSHLLLPLLVALLVMALVVAFYAWRRGLL